MNCPSCSGRNPSNAGHCLHCRAPLTDGSDGGILDLDSEEGVTLFGFQIQHVFFAAVLLFFAIPMLLFGFDTTVVECTQSTSKAAEYEAAPEWQRDESAERQRIEQRTLRKSKSDTRFSSSRDFSNLRCFKKKTGHVDGVVSE